MFITKHNQIFGIFRAQPKLVWEVESKKRLPLDALQGQMDRESVNKITPGCRFQSGGFSGEDCPRALLAAALLFSCCPPLIFLVFPLPLLLLAIRHSLLVKKISPFSPSEILSSLATELSPFPFLFFFFSSQNSRLSPCLSLCLSLPNSQPLPS